MEDYTTDISSSYAMRRELDDIAKHLGIDPDVDVVETHLTFSEDDPLHGAKVAWYVISAKINQAIAKGATLILRFNDEDYDDLNKLDE